MNRFRQCVTVFHLLVVIGSVAARVLDGVHRRSLLADVDYMARPWQGSILPPNSTESGSGCIVLPNFLPPGEALVSPENNLQPSVEACCRSCRELEQCNVYWYCREEGGCTGTFTTARNYTSPFQGCGLDFQSDASEDVGQSILAFPSPGFTGGSPIRISPPAVKGYDLYPGLWLYQSYDYQCNGSEPLFKKMCAKRGTPQNVSYVCDDDPWCRGFVYFEHGRTNLGFPLVIFKGGEGVTELNLSTTYFNPNAALYVKKEPAVLPAVPPDSSGGGGISTGAVVGIVVGSVCAVGLAVAGAIVVLRRHRRQLQEKAQGSGKGSSVQGDGGLAATGELGSSSCFGARQQQQPDSAISVHSGRSHISSAHELHNRTLGLSTSSKGSMRLSATLSHALATVSPPASMSRCPPTQWEVPIDCVASPNGSISSDCLLSQLPDDNWTSSVVDFKDIHFCENLDGSLAQLGSGAFSTVYRVMLSGVAPHAAKVLQLSGDPRQAAMFLKEVSMLRTLRHRNIITFAGVCVWEDKGIILMELAEGKSLHARLASVNKQGERTMRWYGRGKTVALDIANALLYLHSHNVVHFDIKSGNVLLTRDGTAKLCDVGLSRALRHTHQSLSQGSPGTFDFMAPELLMGRPCTPSVDVYSYGILLWEICTGEYAVRGCMNGLSVPEQCPQGVADLFLECIDEDPAKRPTARELTARLMALQQNGQQQRQEV